MFKHAIVKTPCPAMINGITEAQLGPPNYELALHQHQNYIKALQLSGLKVTILPAEEAFPDSCFVEDPAVMTKHCSIITNPGANSRKGEIVAIEQAVTSFNLSVHHIKPPGTLDGGDVMMVDDHFYIGLSARTNRAGATQLIDILESYGMSGSTIDMTDMLHLKTGLSYLENNILVAGGEFIKHPAFTDFDILPVEPDESYAANCIWVNDKVIIPAGFPKTKAMIENTGFEIIAVDVSEFQKIDGGLSCMSLRF